jgi:hypothetical protein
MLFLILQRREDVGFQLSLPFHRGDIKMRTIKAISYLVCLAALSWGCQGETVAPKLSADAGAQSSLEGIQRPDNPCGSSTFTSFLDVNNNNIGSIEVLNTESELFLLVDMNTGWLLQSVKIFAGNSTDLPKSGVGSIQLEEFPYQYALSRAQDKSTFRFGTASLPACYGIAVCGQAVQINMFGGVTNSRQIWVSGTPVLDGRMFSYCNGVCSNVVDSGPASNN